MSNPLRATKDYGLFDLCPFNRDVAKLKYLKESMKKHGFIDAYPIHCVRSANGKLLIKAGHHRFEAAQELGIAVKFVICDDSSTIYELEKATTPWKPTDYLTSFARCDQEAYATVAEYHNRTGIGLRSCIALLGGHTRESGSLVEGFKQGTFQVRDRGQAETVAHIVLHLKALAVAFACNSLFVGAVSRVCRIREFDPDQFLRRVEANLGLMVKQPDQAGYVLLIEQIYNRGSRSKMAVKFLADQIAAERCAVKRGGLKT